MNRIEVTAALAGVAAMLVAHDARAEMRIGLPAVLSGDVSWIGEQHEIGAHRAVADINAAGGLLGEQVVMVTLDDACNPDQAAAVANQLVSEQVVFVNGHTCSGASIAAAPIYEQAGILMISPSSTNPAVTDAGISGVFRVCGRDDDQGRVAGDYLAEHWADKNIGIVHDGLAYGRGLAEQTKRRLNALGVEEVLYESFEASQAEYTALVDKLEAAEVDVLYAGSYQADASVILTQASERGLEFQLVAGDAFASDDWLLFAGEAGKGTLFTFGPDARSIPAAAEVVEVFRNEEGFEPAGYTLYSYATVQVWADAVRRAGTTDAARVADALRSSSFDTVLGTISFDEKGDVVGVESYVWYLWGDVEYAPVD